VTDNERQLLRAARIWLYRIHKNDADRHLATIVSTSSTRESWDSFSRLIKLGGGTIVNSPEEATIMLGDLAELPTLDNIPRYDFAYVNELILNVHE